jgi:hypothetical protein
MARTSAMARSRSKSPALGLLSRGRGGVVPMIASARARPNAAMTPIQARIACSPHPFVAAKLSECFGDVNSP